MDNHTHNMFYLIDDKVEFWPAINTLISCSSREKFTLHYPAAYCLLTLIRNQHQIVMQRELIKTAWGDRSAHVTANTFYQSILTLRRVLRDAGLEREIVQTIPRRGLRIPDYVCIKEGLSENTLIISDSAEDLSSEPVSDFKDDNNEAIHAGVSKNKFSIEGLFFTGYIIIMSLFVAILFLNVKNKIGNMTILNSYQDARIYSLNNCKIYWNSNAVVFTKHKDFVRSINPDCKELRRVYVSTYLRSSQVSMLQCRTTGIINENQYCTSTFYAKY